MYFFTISHLSVIVINSIILALMVKLRDESCNCLVDWRNVYIITFSSLLVLLGLITPFFMAPIDKSTIKNIKTKKPNGAQTFAFIAAMGLTILNIYCLYTYTKDLELSQCNCIKDSLANLFGFVFYYIRISLLLLLVGMVMSLITMLLA